MEHVEGADPSASSLATKRSTAELYVRMVSVVGFQPTTFPAQTGRAKQTALHGDKFR